MKRKRLLQPRLYILVLFFFGSSYILAQNSDKKEVILPLDIEHYKLSLIDAPTEAFNESLKTRDKTISLPSPDGTWKNYYVIESPIIATHHDSHVATKTYKVFNDLQDYGRIVISQQGIRKRYSHGYMTILFFT